MDITEIIQIAIAIIGAIWTYIIVPFVKAKTTEKQRENIAFWVEKAVEAAEQVLAGTERGVEKKRYVYDWLEKKGLTFDQDEVELLIESTVNKMNKELF